MQRGMDNKLEKQPQEAADPIAQGSERSGSEVANQATAQTSNDYVIGVLDRWDQVPAHEWDHLLAQSPVPTPFMQHAYGASLVASGSAVAKTGWTLKLLTLRRAGELRAACAVYLKTHSYGEYVFDWAWAQAYQRHGLPYYPKAVVSVPAATGADRLALAQALRDWAESETRLSSMHVLFADASDWQALHQAGFSQRHTVQFHYEGPHDSFDMFLAALSQDKRKKIRQERRKVSDAGVVFRHAQGEQISPHDWAFFYRCYERTYLEHGNPPYLKPAFFEALAREQPHHWLMFIAEQNGQPIASSLVAVDLPRSVAYGRYWGALERVNCLHFEACYYQPLAWCMAHGVRRFEGGAQGEHKIQRALLPVDTTSAHWVRHPAFAEAVNDFLSREANATEDYLRALQAHSPYRQG
jgi:uncharacterized protein